MRRSRRWRLAAAPRELWYCVRCMRLLPTTCGRWAAWQIQTVSFRSTTVANVSPLRRARSAACSGIRMTSEPRPTPRITAARIHWRRRREENLPKTRVAHALLRTRRLRGHGHGRRDGRLDVLTSECRRISPCVADEEPPHRPRDGRDGARASRRRRHGVAGPTLPNLAGRREARRHRPPGGVTGRHRPLCRTR
jgi:hypothetical protein